VICFARQACECTSFLRFLLLVHAVLLILFVKIPFFFFSITPTLPLLAKSHPSFFITLHLPRLGPIPSRMCHSLCLCLTPLTTIVYFCPPFPSALRAVFFFFPPPPPPPRLYTISKELSPFSFLFSDAFLRCQKGTPRCDSVPRFTRNRLGFPGLPRPFSSFLRFFFPPFDSLQKRFSYSCFRRPLPSVASPFLLPMSGVSFPFSSLLVL